MKILKKKNILEYKINDEHESNLDEDNVDISEELEELEEFVNNMGASISGDEPKANDSEIKVSKGATTDSNMQKRIQPNRYLFNVDGQAARGGVDGTIGVMDSYYKIAKDKMLKLLEDIDGPQFSSSKETTDFNDNGVVDINELPPNVARKLIDLVDAVTNNNLPEEQVEIILKFINQKLNAQ